MSQHNALLLTALKTPLKVGKRTIPIPGPGELLVKVDAAGLNPHDSKGVEYGLFVNDYLPAAVLAADIAGTIVQLGPNVTHHAIGDRVFSQSDFFHGHAADQAGLQEYAIIDAAHTAKIPPAHSADGMATLPVNTVAPFIAFFHPDQLGLTAPTKGQKSDYSNEAILIVGGGANTGRYGVAFARMARFGTIVAIASTRNTERLKALGATHVVDRYGSDAEVEARVREIVGDELVYALDVVSEPVGGDVKAPSASVALACLSRTRKGKLATLLPGGADQEIAKTKGAGYQKTFTSGLSHLYPELMAPFWQELPGWVEMGLIQPSEFEVVEGLDADKVNAFLDGYRDGKAVKKASIHPWGKAGS